MQQIKDKKSYIIVVGNEKGGAGKTTSTMHLIASLLKLGFKVSSVDTDHRQASLSRYLENRHQTIEKNNLSLPTPTHYRTSSSTQNTISDIEKEEKQQLLDIIDKERDQVDFIVIDTPGSNSNLSRFAHSYADTIITPINDSFIDLDLLALVDGESLNVVKPGIYSQMVWEQKIERAKREQKAADWIVMRNRLTSVDAKNKRNMETVVGNLAKRVGFRVAPGFGERDSLLTMELAKEERIGEVSQDLRSLDGMTTELIAKLADNQVHTRDDLAELAVDELVEATQIDEETAKTLIMKAREHWFTS